jgi:hypothetical protein
MALITDFDPQGIEEHQRIDRLQRPRLPYRDLVQHGVGDGRDQIGRDVDTVASFTRKRPSRQPFPDHLPRERVIVPGPVACSCCGGSRLSRLGEDVTETLEVIPRPGR